LRWRAADRFHALRGKAFPDVGDQRRMLMSLNGFRDKRHYLSMVR
jgi:hypothetical protein